MKNISVIIFAFILISQVINAQIRVEDKQGKSSNANYTYKQPRNCSPYAAMLLTEFKQKKSNKQLIEKFNLFEKDNRLVVSIFMKVTAEFDNSYLQGLDIHINTQSDNIYTALIPIENLERLFTITGIEYIEIAHKVKPKLDEARAKTWVDWVHSGTDLSHSYTGEGVIVGIIDNGFDYTHPTFFNSDNTEYRISRVWEQSESGTPPSGRIYGNELIGQSDILNDGYSTTTESHGTHVAGIAAGSGSVLSTYKGVAFNSELVLVHYDGIDPFIADGIDYIFDYANSIGKPAVINMSLGTHYGPHDGTSLFDQMCDGIVGEGKILVGAAGNEGSDKLHLNYDLSSDETIFSFIEFPSNFSHPNAGSTFIDIWGEVGDDLTVSINIYNIDDSEFEDYTDYISTSTDGEYNFNLLDEDPSNSDECPVFIAVEHSNSQNSKPHIYIEFDNTDQDEVGDIYDYILLEINGTNTSFNAWCSNAGEAVFTNKGESIPVIDGNNNLTVGEIGGTSNSIITVGAYTSKNEYTDYQDIIHQIDFYTEVGEIAPFSSLGPTADGRTKPDITAPGNVIVSSINSFDTEYTSDSEYVVAGLTDGTNDWWFATMEGTSMASPMVTGIVALWLEADPTLTPTEVKQVMQNHAWTDIYTGSVPNNTWGYGKIDAHETIKAIEIATGIDDHMILKDFTLYPNPSNGQFTIIVNDETKSNLQIFDISGKLVYTEHITTNGNRKNINIPNLINGIYILKLSNNNHAIISKLVINR